MTKTLFSNYVPRTNGNRSIEEAISELQREMDVRKRLFDKWVHEARMSWVDAHDRLERHMSALKLLIKLSADQDKQQSSDNNPTLIDGEESPALSLDVSSSELPA